MKMEKGEKIEITIINGRSCDRKRTSSSRWFAKPAAGTIKSILSGLIAAGLFSFVLYAFAVPPDSKYNPGDTLTPSCTPGSTNCSVVAPAVYSFSANNFSGTGTFTTTGTITGAILNITGLTASKPVFTDASKNLTSSGTLGVDQGGTGLATLTAYAVLAGGTTTTGILQQVSGLGTSGYVLTSNGAGALPTWQVAAASGANTALSNLASVAVNAALIPGTAGALSFGSATYPWADIYFAGTSATPGTNNFKITGTSTSGTRTITIPDASGTVPLGTGATTQLAYWSGTNALTSSGNMTFDGTTLTAAGFIGPLKVSSTTGVNLTATNGVLTMAGLKSAGNNENLTFDFETTANQVAIGTGTGVTTISLGSLILTTTGAGTFGNLQTGANGADGQLTIYSEQGATDYNLVFQPNAAMTESSTYVFPAAKPASNKILQSDLSGNLTWVSDSDTVGANTTLSNLADTIAINKVLIPGTAGALSFGSATYPWADIYFAGTSATPGTNNFKITGTSTSGTRTITIPDASGTVAYGTGTANYPAYWSGTNTLAGEQYLALSRGGTAASLTANTGGIVYSGASALAILAGTATANQILMSGLSAAPAWSTATYPATTTINQILYSSGTNVIGGITTGNSGVLITGATGIPSIATDIPTAVTIGGKYIYRADGTDVPVADGGTGLSAMVAYAVLAGGTTTTGILQQVSGLGTSGYVLTSSGAAALPTWQAAGTGTVTGSGAINRVAYWSSASALTSNAGFTFDGTTLTAPTMNITTESSGYQADSIRLLSYYGTSGTENLFLGQSGNFTLTGTKNILAGYQAGLALTTGYGNQFIGYQAGYSTTTGSNDVFIGEQAGYTNIVGVANVFLGYQAGYYETGSNKLFIDNQQRTDEADARTKALVYGVFDAAVANQTLTINGQPYLSVLAVGTGSAGAITADTTTGKLYVASSSLKYKHDIQPLTEDWAAILQAQPKSFKYNGSNQPDIGYIAEDFDLLGLKDLVLYDDQGRPNAIKYDRITLYNTEILKQQQIDINTLKQRLGITTENVAINPAGTVGSGSVLGVNDLSVQSSLANLGVTLVEGMMSLKQVIVDNFTAKTADIEQINIQKMQIVDQATGDIYCTWIENGDWQKTKGECVSTEITSEVIQTEQLQPSAEEIVQQVTKQATQQVVEQVSEQVSQQTQQAAQEVVQQATEQVIEEQEQSTKEAAKEAAQEIKEEIKQEVKEELQQEIQQPSTEEQTPIEEAAPASLLRKMTDFIKKLASFVKDTTVLTASAMSGLIQKLGGFVKSLTERIGQLF